MTLADYAEYCQSKSEREIPEGYEFQEFPLVSEGLPDPLRSDKRHGLERMTGEFHYLKVRPEYPIQVTMVALVRLQCNVEAMPSCVDRSQESQWVASIWIVEGLCQVDLVWALKDNRLDFVEGHCSHGDLCPKVEELKKAILESVAFAQLREDLIEKLFQRTVADLDPVEPLPSPQTVPPGEEDRDHWACERL